MSEFLKMKAHFINLCKQFGLEPPDIRPALLTDPCDVTDPPYVRINLRQDCDRTYQVLDFLPHLWTDHFHPKSTFTKNCFQDIAVKLFMLVAQGVQA